MSDLLYQIAVTHIPKAGPILIRQLVAWCGGAKAVFEASPKELLRIPGIGKAMVDNVTKKASFKAAERELAFIENHDIQTFFYLDDNYPRRLVHYPNAPVLLYYQGNMDLNHPRTVGIVGTRKATQRGKITCEELVEGLKEYDVAIISGMAYGIDITAHRKAVELGMPTLGCLGHGLQVMYPSAHRQTGRDMLAKGGLLTEFDSSKRPDAPHFPMRNRIIAGLSDALIVLETARRGGSMITANMAHQYHKDVFAVPGRVNDPYSQGCNLLIRSHKAQLLETAGDIGYIMRWEKGASQVQAAQRELFVELSEEERKIVDCLTGKDSESVDGISYGTGFTQGQLSMILLDLEFKGLVKSLPGKRYMKV